MRQLKIIALATVLSACAASYRVPTEQAPLGWREDGTSLRLQPINESITTFGGTLGPGDAVLAFEVENLRTGVLAEEVVWETPLGTTESLPAGTPVYARQFSLSMQTYRNYSPVGPARNLNRLNNPIEWCAPREDDAVCIFWEGPGEARYISSRGDIPQSVTLTSTSGPSGPVPIIREQAVEFGHPMRVRFEIERVDNRELRLKGRIYEKSERANFGGSARLEWGELSEPYSLLGAKYHFTPLEDSDGNVQRVEVEVIEQPEKIVMFQAGSAEAVRTLIEALARFKAEQDDAAEEAESDVAPEI